MLSFISLTEEHQTAVLDIFNYYIRTTNSAYRRNELVPSDYAMFLDNAKKLCGFVIKNSNNDIIGFCQLKPYSPVNTFEETVEITYFLLPEYTGKGFGKEILDYLIQEAKKRNMKHILASISGDNLVSQKFHSKNGFIEVGRFNKIGFKNGKAFDIVYMQRDIG